jgi:hypothetical protein
MSYQDHRPAYEPLSLVQLAQLLAGVDTATTDHGWQIISPIATGQMSAWLAICTNKPFQDF